MVCACPRNVHDNEAMSIQHSGFPHHRRPPQIPSLGPLLHSMKDHQSHRWNGMLPATERSSNPFHGTPSSSQSQRFYAADSLEGDRWQASASTDSSSGWRDATTNAFVPSGAMSARQLGRSNLRLFPYGGRNGYRYPGLDDADHADWEPNWDKNTPSFPLRIPPCDHAARSVYARPPANYKDNGGDKKHDPHPGFFPMPERLFPEDQRLCANDRYRLSSSSEQQAPLSVFVGNIPKNTSPDTFHRLMALKGTVTEIVCTFHPDCWLTAFVTYSKHSEALKAVEYFNNRRAIKVAQPHRLVCCFAPHPPASLCCSTLPADLEPGTTALLPFFPKFSREKAELMPHGRRSLLAPRFSLLRDGPPGANLFIYGIPSDWTEVTLMRLCQEFGHIVGIRVPGAPTSGQQRLNKGFGFVSYDNTEGSAAALETLSGRQFLGKPLNIQLKLGEQLTGYSPNTNGIQSHNKGRRQPQTASEISSVTSRHCTSTNPTVDSNETDGFLKDSPSQPQDIAQPTQHDTHRSVDNKGAWTSSRSQQSPFDSSQQSPFDSSQQSPLYPLTEMTGSLSLSPARTPKRISSAAWGEGPQNNTSHSCDGLVELEGAVAHTMQAFADASAKSSSFSDGSAALTVSTSATDHVPSPSPRESDLPRNDHEQQSFPGDTTALLHSVLGFLTLFTEQRSYGPPTGNTRALSNNDDPLIVDGINAESELWKFLEDQLSREIDPSLVTPSIAANGTPAGRPDVDIAGPSNYQSSHDDLKASFSRWREESFSRKQGLQLPLGGASAERLIHAAMPEKSPACFSHLHPQNSLPN